MLVCSRKRRRLRCFLLLSGQTIDAIEKCQRGNPDEYIEKSEDRIDDSDDCFAKCRNLQTILTSRSADSDFDVDLIFGNRNVCLRRRLHRGR